MHYIDHYVTAGTYNPKASESNPENNRYQEPFFNLHITSIFSFSENTFLNNLLHKIQNVKSISCPVEKWIWKGGVVPKRYRKKAAECKEEPNPASPPRWGLFEAAKINPRGQTCGDDDSQQKIDQTEPETQSRSYCLSEYHGPGRNQCPKWIAEPFFRIRFSGKKAENRLRIPSADLRYRTGNEQDSVAKLRNQKLFYLHITSISSIPGNEFHAS
ncbi:MAG: hypothetical protein IKO93_20590 [Lentisphaeria bacterium]|nr:hypothetical protein [Lentisphaeria bacterium]